jgi:hypothetical protein
MNRVILASLLGALVLFAWTSAVWMVSPMPEKIITPAGNSAATGMLLSGLFPESGLYLIPPMPSGDANAYLPEQDSTGPRFQIFVDRQGINPAMTQEMLLGFAHNLLSVSVIAYILFRLLGGMQNFTCRFLFVAALGGVISFQAFLDYIWWPQPLVYHLWLFAANFIGWLLVGLVLAGIIKPAAQN